MFRVGVEPPKELRGGGFLQLDGGNKAQYVVPVGCDERRFDIPIGEQLIAMLRIIGKYLSGLRKLKHVIVLTAGFETQL